MSEASPAPRTTCWRLIEQASRGSRADRETFASRYLDVVRAYLAHRWRGSAALGELEDAVQEVFLECFRRGGVLDRVHVEQPASFRAFLYGVARNVARRWEKRAGRERGRQRASALDLDELESDEATQSRVFDRAWAQAIFRQAGVLQRTRASESGAGALRRVELLELRAREDLPIREIAARWGRDPAAVHKEYAKARGEFRAALLDVIAFHHAGLSDVELEEKCVELLELLRG